MRIVGCSATGLWSADNLFVLLAIVYTIFAVPAAVPAAASPSFSPSSELGGEVSETGAGGTASLAYILHPALELFPRNSVGSPILKRGMASAAPAEALRAMWLQVAVWWVGVMIASAPRT
jgi:hypothetical protein